MTTETIDKLFLELSRVTTAKTEREIRLERERDEALRVAERQRAILEGYGSVGRLATIEQLIARAEKAERERDAARDSLARVRCETYDEIVKLRAERDARPDISAEDALLMEDARATLELPAYEHGPEHQDAAMRIARALRAHAAKAGKP